MSALLAGPAALAQEAYRSSLAGDAAIEARQQQLENQPYTIKSGDFRLLVIPSLGLEFNDNVNISDRQPQEDFILKPLLQLNGSYPITRHNLLRLNVGVGYDQYFQHNEYSDLRLQSGSQVDFDIYVKDFWINLHDRFQYIRDSAAQAAIANTARYGGLDNTVGLTGTWDLRDLVLTLGYDHRNFVSSTAEFDYINRASELLTSRVGFHLHPRLTTGVEGSATFTTYDQKYLNDNSDYSAGVYAEWRPSAYFKVQPRIGYTVYDFDQTSTVIPAVDQDTWYASITVTHEATEALSYALSAGHDLHLGIEADSIEVWYLRPSATWRLIKGVTLNTYISYEHGSQGSGRGGTFAETYDWFGGGFGVSYDLTKKLTASLNYRLTNRTSGTGDRDYTQNLVGLLFTYTFK